VLIPLRKMEREPEKKSYIYSESEGKSVQWGSLHIVYLETTK
jgi:hypothetical protein